MFPNLKERRASRARACRAASSRCWRVARILRTGARLLLLDEISEGLAPVIVQTLARDRSSACAGRATPSSWWSRTSASPRRSPTASTSWSTAGSCEQLRRSANCTDNMAMLHEFLGV